MSSSEKISDNVKINHGEKAAATDAFKPPVYNPRLEVEAFTRAVKFGLIGIFAGGILGVLVGVSGGSIVSQKFGIINALSFGLSMTVAGGFLGGALGAALGVSQK